MSPINRLIENNRTWADALKARDPEFFAKRENDQAPLFLMIGCSDSRVPLEVMTGAQPGDMFVHRNIGNQVYATDLNVLSVVHFAVTILDVKHIIVCGHTNCGALRAAEKTAGMGIVDHWIAGVRNTIRRHKSELEQFTGEEERLRRLSELNVLQQVGVLSRTPTVLDAWSRGQRPLLHGWVYDIGTGHVKPVVESIGSVEQAGAALPTG